MTVSADVHAADGPAGARRRFSISTPLAFAWVSTIALGWVLLPGALIFLAIISVLVAVHEGAHLLAARSQGMHCSEYAIGFGPKVASVRFDELTVALRLVPAGGFVRITGMSRTEQVAPELEARTYRAAPLRSRLLAVAAGPLSNLAAGFVLATVAFGVFTPAGQRSANPVAEAAAFSTDLVTASFSGYGHIVTSIDDYPETIASGGESGGAARVMSPVSASQLAGYASEAGAREVLLFAALVSIALGAFNALPLVPLDGGHALVAIVEHVGSKLTRRDFHLPVNVQVAATYVVLAVLLTLSASGVYLDIVAPQANPFGS